MKKLIFLLIMAHALIGFIPAQDIANQPGDVILVATMAEYGIYEDAVPQPAVLVCAAIVQPASIEADILIKSGNITHDRKSFVVTDYFMRC